MFATSVVKSNDMCIPVASVLRCSRFYRPPLSGGLIANGVYKKRGQPHMKATEANLLVLMGVAKMQFVIPMCQ